MIHIFTFSVYKIYKEYFDEKPLYLQTIKSELFLFFNDQTTFDYSTQYQFSIIMLRALNKTKERILL